ncbi:MAG: zinc ribbon domain-containing protein [Phycisphaerales bacterium]|nr:zinc ribbon domain-containing protein [Phycisphaerales bacterium]
MPTYDYKCKTCGHTWELFQSMSAKPVKACPDCGRKTAERLIGTGAALLFKGSGFYQTDYRSEGYRKSAEADKKSASGGDAGSGTTEAKPAAKGGDTKPAPASDGASKPKADPKPTPTKPKKKSEE